MQGWRVNVLGLGVVGGLLVPAKSESMIDCLGLKVWGLGILGLEFPFRCELG